MTNDSLTCTICDTQMHGEYCHICGQRQTGKKITFRELFSDFISGMFSLERSVLATIWLIISQPPKIINNYWAGWRGYYHSPGKLAFYAAFVVGLHFAFMGSELLGINIKFTNIPPQLGLIIVLIPLYSITSKLTFFIRKRTFLEHLIAMIYLFSTWIIVFIFLDLIQRFGLGNPLDEVMFLAYITVVFIWAARIHAPESKWYYILGYSILQIIILTLIITLIIGLIYLLFPEAITSTGSGGNL